MNNLLPLATVSLISYAIANLLGVEPIYETLMSKIIEGSPDSKEFTKHSEKVIKSYVIPIGSPLDKKKIKEINWGRHALIVTVERGEESITPHGDVELHAGDEIVFLVSQRRFAKDAQHLETLFEINNFTT
jgi:Trk K+ transport system NAD-binding subunit